MSGDGHGCDGPRPMRSNFFPTRTGQVDSRWDVYGAYHALRHSFISVLVAQGKRWDQIAAFVGHLDQKTTQRYIHFMPKDKRETAISIPFDF